jgi:hypothetical protein
MWAFHASQPIFGGTDEVGYGALYRRVSSPRPMT